MSKNPENDDKLFVVLENLMRAVSDDVENMSDGDLEMVVQGSAKSCHAVSGVVFEMFCAAYKEQTRRASVTSKPRFRFDGLN